MAKLLEALNEAAIIPSFIILLILVRYLSKEATRRGLHAFDWIHLPANMNLVLSLFILDAALTLKFSSIVIWYMVGQNLFDVQYLFLVAIIGLIVGLLCRIKAITQPEYGLLPWSLSTISTIIAVFVLLIK